MHVRIVVLLVALVLWAPGWTTGPARAAEPQSLATSRLTILADGQKLVFEVQWARRESELRKGLMFRRSMPMDHGMLLDYGSPQRASIWMRNTYIPLDILFVRADGVIESIEQGRPLDETTIPSRGPVRAVLELNAGVARLYGIEPGDQVLHPAFGTDE